MYILFRKRSKSWVIGTYTLYLYYPKETIVISNQKILENNSLSSN